MTKDGADWGHFFGAKMNVERDAPAMAQRIKTKGLRDHTIGFEDDEMMANGRWLGALHTERERAR
jgi:hypothetical protein